jgi:hypothetical protein
VEAQTSAQLRAALNDAIAGTAAAVECALGAANAAGA